jgi:serine/threonine protein kinase
MNRIAMQQLGRFQITRELGRGGMGIVYEAIDPIIGRTVAIKTIRTDNSAETSSLLDRLFREARSAGALAHPNIVIIFDVGRDGDLAYIAMERVDGPTLEQLLVPDRTPPHSFTLDILRQTADALDHAHEHGIVHRDIKPGNIMLHKSKTVKVTDFGIAKIQDPQHRTRTGSFIGTPAYMSPEQITAKAVDGRSDQFSLGVIAFEMLTGAMAFPGDDLGSLTYQIVHGDRPSAIATNPTLTPQVDGVLQRALSRDPNDRYATCTEFIRALTISLNATRVTQHELSPSAHLPRPVSPEPNIPAPSRTSPPRATLVEPPHAAMRRSKTKLWSITGALAVALLGWLGYLMFRPILKTMVNPKDNLTYVWVPPGQFDMGCSPDDGECRNDEKPRHHVTISEGFWIGQTEVTQAAYQRVIGSNPSNARGEKLPVEMVSLDEAVHFCLAVGMMLPTEAQWEYAARGGDPAARYGALDTIAWYSDNSGGKMHEVGQKQKNGYGLFDMLGNVSEWTWDIYDAEYYASSPGINPSPHPISDYKENVVRGGSCLNDSPWLRASSRSHDASAGRFLSHGFRCTGHSIKQ